MKLALVALFVALGAATAPAQQPAVAQPVGWRSAVIDNPDEDGSKRLAALVYYPAAPDQRGERQVALARREGGHPVVVLLHGHGSQAAHMKAIGAHLAGAGYVTVLTDTTSRDRALQATNARAFYAALQAENAREGAFFQGQLDLTRAGLAGHSMGGGNTVRVLADNPGYRAGFCFAPWTTRSRGNPDYVAEFAPRVTVPLGIVHGVDDQVLAWRRNALRLQEASSDAGPAFRGLWLADPRVNHINIAVPFPPTDEHRAAFAECARLATAFFDRFLRGVDTALDDYLEAEQLPGWVEALHVRKS